MLDFGLEDQEFESHSEQNIFFRFFPVFSLFFTFFPIFIHFFSFFVNVNTLQKTALGQDVSSCLLKCLQALESVKKLQAIQETFKNHRIIVLSFQDILGLIVLQKSYFEPSGNPGDF